MTFAEFETLAEREWERIPDTFKEGVDALVILRDAKAHTRSPDVYTLGECLTESYPSDYDGPDTIRSEVILYYGSFRRLASTDEDFDWEAEVWETLTHELQHHLETLAAEDDLEDVDAAMEQHFRRHDGEPFDAFYFRGGESLGNGWWRVEDTFFFEPGAGPGELVTFEWEGVSYRVHAPDVEGAGVLFLRLDGVRNPPAELVLVLARRASLASRFRALLRREAVTVAELSAQAEPA